MKKLLLLITIMLSVAAFGQTTYTLSTYTSTYTELTNATPVEPILEEGFEEDEEYWDDPLYFIPLAFGFQVGDSVYNSLIQFGDGAEIMIANLNFTDTLLTSTTVHFFGLYDDLADAAAIEGLSASEITYNTTGDIGNRITKIQYKDAAFYEEVHGSEPAAENRMSFQLWFYEDNGIMEIHFGESNVPDPELVFYGNTGPAIVIGIDIDVSDDDEDEEGGWAGIAIGNPASPTLYTGTIDLIDEGSLNGIPERGRVYRFSPSGIVGTINAETPKFSIYPTLAQNQISVKNVAITNAAYRIIDITGKQVKTGSLTENSPVSISDLKSGLYIFSIDGMAHAVKFVKE